MKGFVYRTEEKTLNILRKIAEEEHRSMNQELEHIVQQYILKYTLEQGGMAPPGIGQSWQRRKD